MIGTIASLAGLAVGYGLAVGLKAIMDSAGFDLGFDGVVMATSTVVIAMVVGVGSTLLASFLPALRASRIAPLAALRESAVDSTSASKGRLIGGTVLTALGVATVVTATMADQALGRAGHRRTADPRRCGRPRPGRRSARGRACWATYRASCAARPAVWLGGTRCATPAARRAAHRR